MAADDEKATKKFINGALEKMIYHRHFSKMKKMNLQAFDIYYSKTSLPEQISNDSYGNREIWMQILV